MNSTQIREGSELNASVPNTPEAGSFAKKQIELSEAGSFAKEQIELMLRARIREELEEFCLINIFAGFGYDPLVFAAFGIDTKEVLFQEMDAIKQKLKEADYEITEQHC